MHKEWSREIDLSPTNMEDGPNQRDMVSLA